MATKTKTRQPYKYRVMCYRYQTLIKFDFFMDANDAKEYARAWVKENGTTNSATRSVVKHD